MSQAQTVPLALPVRSRPLMSTFAEAVSVRIIWFIVVCQIVAMLGAIWDISWHMSIGRETFWTVPHLMIQASAILVVIVCGYVILTTTFAGNFPARDASVQLLGFYAPIGAFIALWGSVAIIVSAPWDNWFHNAYGLDVKIINPPHMLLSLGSFASKIGAMAWIASIVNRSRRTLQGSLGWAILIVGSIGLTQLSVMVYRETWFTNMHTATCYLAVAISMPCWLIACGLGSAHKWGCTIAAGLYTGILLGAEWLLPLVPAQPKLGPVYHNVTHLIPLQLPLLLIVPALVTDLLLHRLKHQPSWIKAVSIGPAFLLSFLAVQWPFADFLVSPASRNWVFGTAYFPYMSPAGVLYDPYKFNVKENTPGAFLLTMAIAFAVSLVTTRLGLGWGSWMRKVRR
jgi:hypothetical protein